MARGVNKVILVGNLGNDPEVKYMPSGGAVANITVATSDTWKDKQSGESQERTEWHRVVMFGRLGEIAGEYLRKGSKVYIEGRLQTRKWQDKSGVDRYTTEIIAAEMQMLDGRGSAVQNQSSGEFDGGMASAPAPSPTQNRPMAAPSKPAPMASPPPDFDDDIPF